MSPGDQKQGNDLELAVGKLYVFPSSYLIFKRLPFAVSDAFTTEKDDVFLVLDKDYRCASRRERTGDAGYYYYTEVLVSDQHGWLVLANEPSTLTFQPFRGDYG